MRVKRSTTTFKAPEFSMGLGNAEKSALYVRVHSGLEGGDDLQQGPTRELSAIAP